MENNVTEYSYICMQVLGASNWKLDEANLGGLQRDR